MTDPKKLVAAGYDRIAERYASWCAGARERQYWLGALLNRLPPQSRILDLGSGDGRVARKLCTNGHDVVGIDISPVQIERARRNAPDARFLVGDISNCPFKRKSFDAVTAFYSITHVPRCEHEQLLFDVAQLLRPGGIFVASMGAKPSDDWCGPWLGTQMFFSHFDAATNRALVKKCGLVIEREEIREEIENGTSVPFLWIAASRL